MCLFVLMLEYKSLPMNMLCITEQCHPDESGFKSVLMAMYNGEIFLPGDNIQIMTKVSE